MAEKHPDYWEIKAAFLQLKIDEADAIRKFRALLVAKGLKESAHYTMDDATQTIVEQEAT